MITEILTKKPSPSLFSQMGQLEEDDYLINKSKEERQALTQPIEEESEIININGQTLINQSKVYSEVNQIYFDIERVH